MLSRFDWSRAVCSPVIVHPGEQTVNLKLKEAHPLAAEAQAALRDRVVNAIANGMSQSEATRVFNVSRTAVHHCAKAVNEQDAKALKAKRGRDPRHV